MKPRFFTLRNLFLLLIAGGIFGGLAYWIHEGMPLPGQGVPSTKGKMVFVSTRGGHPDLYMMNASDGSGAIALTNDAAEDHAPKFGQGGNEITFTSTNRNGATSQVYRMDAMANAKVLQVTNTSSSKEAPRYTEKDIICFLDTGKVVNANVKDNDTDAEFPSSHMRLALTNLFSTGGIDKLDVSPDAKRYLCVMKMEEGKFLVLFAPDEEALVMLGAAKDIIAKFRPDGSFVAAFSGGAPFGEPQVLMSPKMMENPGFNIPAVNIPLPGEANILVTYDQTLKLVGQPEPLPAAIGEMAVSPDGKQIAFIAADAANKGLVVHPLDSPGKVTMLYPETASQPVWSPDGTQLAFVASNDIYTVSAGGGEPKNLTKGSGTNSSPEWSPATK